MSRIKISTSFNIELDFDLAEFHRRLFAWAIDLITIILYLILCSKILRVLDLRIDSEDAWGVQLIIILPAALYQLVMESLMHGQTLGKKLMNIRVINETGGNATLAQYLIRWMLRVTDLIMAILIILFLIYGPAIAKAMPFFFGLAITDVLCVALTKKSQRLGDMAAGTIVIKTKQETSLNDTVFMEIADTYVPLYPQVMKLSDRDMNTLRNIYKTIVKRNDYQLAAQTAEKVRRAIQVEIKQDPADFIETLLKDYNFLSSR